MEVLIIEWLTTHHCHGDHHRRPVAPSGDV